MHYRRTRSGSVLLIVVILLLMLTILGTAFVSTSHSDRISSDQGVKNAQSDLTAQTIGDTVISKIQQDLTDPSAPQMYANANPLTTSYSGNFRGRIAYRGDYSATAYYNFGDVIRSIAAPPVYYEFVNTVQTIGSGAVLPTFPASSNTYWQAINLMGAGPDATYGTTDDTGAISLSGITSSLTQPWLADRIPTWDVANNVPYWQNISQPTLYSGTFESPDGTLANTTTPETTFSPFTTYAPGVGKLYPGYGTLNGKLVPLLGIVPPSLYVNGSGTPQNPLQLPIPSASSMIGKVTIAGDASGQGIADSLLQRIPGSFADGLTWYAAVRVVDNNAAINVNTAYSRDVDYDFSGNASYPNWGLFQSGVGLQELPLNASDMTGSPASPASLNSYRFNGAVQNTPVDDSRLVHNGNTPIVIASLRSEMSFITAGDAAHHESMRRLENPGLILPDPAVTTQNPALQYQRYHPFPASDTATLAYHFGLPSSLTTFSLSGPFPTLLETYLPNSLVYSGSNPPRTQPYGQDITTVTTDPTTWANNQFPWISNPAATVLNLRSLLVTRNGVSNYTAPAYNPDPAHPGETINPAMLTYGSNRATNRIQYRANAAGTSLVFDIGQTYQINDVVIDANTPANTYISRQDNNVAHGALTTPDIATVDTDGNPMWWNRVGTDKGIWSSASTYNLGDIVHLNGLTFVSTGTNTNLPPSPVGQYATRANPAAANSVPAIIFTPTAGPSPSGYDVDIAPTGASHWLRPPQYMGAYDGSWDTVGTPTTTIYGQGDIVLNDIANGGDGFTYICVAPNDPTKGYVDAATTGGVAPGGMTPAVLEATPTIWQLQPYSAQPTKANANTATFRELFRAYWNVMSGTQGNLSPFGGVQNPGNPTGIANYNPYDYQGLNATPAVANGTGNPQHMFRSSLRDPTYVANVTATTPGNTVRMDPTNMAQLRAAIAAVNTLGERDNSQNIISRTVPLNAYVGGVVTPMEARVYSAAPQPFITEIYADTDTGSGDPNGAAPGNTAGYVAIELFNPYSFPLVMVGDGAAHNSWKVGYISRQTTGVTGTLSIVATAVGDLVQVATVAGTPTDQPGASIIIQPHSYALLENYNPAAPGGVAGDAVFRPHAGGFATGAEPAGAATGVWTGPVGGATNSVDVWVSGLQNVFNNEFVLLRPRRADGVYTSCADPLNTFNEGTYAGVSPVPVPNLAQLIPVDSYDFTGLAGVAGNSPEWHYIRAKEDTALGGVTPFNLFKATYPGRYRADGTAGVPRQEGTAVALITATSGAEPAWTSTTGAQVPPTNGVNPPTATWASYFPYATYLNPYPAIKVYDCAANFNLPAAGDYSPKHWPNALTFPVISAAGVVTPTNATGTYAFPFGGFGRNGDILDTMYMGAYKIQTVAQYTTEVTTPTSGVFTELNSLPMDCSFADNGTTINTTNYGSATVTGLWTSGTTYAKGNIVFEPTNTSSYYVCIAAPQSITTTTPSQDPADWQPLIENIGRFCPQDGGGAFTTAGLADNYAWARNLFNYVSVQNYNDDYLPNTDPGPNDLTINTVTLAAANANANKYPGARPAQVYNSDGSATNQVNQHNSAVEGLININTADWKTLSMLPFVSPAMDSVNYDADNRAIAQAIVGYRTANGPFLSIFDLNRVAGFQTANGIYNPNTTSPTSTMGSLSPPDPAFPLATNATSSLVFGDFAANNLILTRISNLITTHSDNYTVYVEIQGWQNAVVPGGTPAPTQAAFPKITRRYAVIVDRSQMSIDPTTHYPKTIVVPNN